MSWKVTSIDRLSLFDQLELKSDEIKALPKDLLKSIFDGFSRLLDRMVLPADMKSLRFSATTNRDGMRLKVNDEERNVPIDSKLMKAFRKIAGLEPYTPPSGFSQRVRQECNVAVASDLNSIGRNGLSAAGKGASLIPFSAIAGGLVSLSVGSKLVQNGLSAYKYATNEEGKITSVANVVEGGSMATNGATAIAGSLPAAVKVLPSGASYLVPMSIAVKKTPHLLSALSILGGVASVVMGTVEVWSAIYHEIKLSEFRKNLKKDGLQYLETFAIVKEGENHKEKADRLVRRVGEDCAKEIANLFQDIHAGKEVSSERIDAVLKKADKESFKLQVKQGILFLIGLLYIFVGLLSLLTPLGIIVPILFAIGAGIWLLVDSQRVSNAVGDFFWHLKNKI